ncbi:hypothetical protein ABZW18_01925 [Streptomyces sp. NPDC004647]|uniref:hypothetical protein n=1 Tax=Streptomyces sp. NPDC004647 TaxID=3154671 RepID=UPI0033B6C159
MRRLYAKLAEVVAADDRQGGTKAVEDTALAYADEAMDLQQRGYASQRVRGQIFSAAAAFTSSAMWAAIDGRRLDDAQHHLNQAVTLAGLSADPAVQFRVWGHAGALYRQLGQYTQALAADEAAKSRRSHAATLFTHPSPTPVPPFTRLTSATAPQPSGPWVAPRMPSAKPTSPDLARHGCASTTRRSWNSLR